MRRTAPIRKLFATNVEKNTVHGSDSLDNAKNEIAYFFRETERSVRTSTSANSNLDVASETKALPFRSSGGFRLWWGTPGASSISGS